MIGKKEDIESFKKALNFMKQKVFYEKS